MAHPSSSPDAVWARIAATVREARPNRPAGRHWSRLVLAFTAIATIGLLLTENVASEWATSRELAQTRHAWAAGGLRRAADEARVAPSARPVQLRSTDGRLLVDAVTLPDGTGYLLAGNLPPLPAGRTYQLWALADTARISVANIGRRVETVAFDVATNIWGLAITVETATGVMRTEHQPIVVGQIAATSRTP